MTADLPRTPVGGGARIREIERRMLLRTPDGQGASTGAAAPAGSADGGGSDKENDNGGGALVLHSPLLASMLPNSTKIRQFESDVLRRQAEYAARISDLEGRLATFHSRLAVECAEREREHALTLEEYINGPLEQAIRGGLTKIDTDFVRPIMDRSRATPLHGKSSAEEAPSEAVNENNNESETNETEVGGKSKDATTARSLPNLVSIERGTNLLEAQMNHHQHVTVFHSRRENFDSVDRKCRHTLQPDLALEMTKADKRESGMVRRFDSSSGEYTRQVAEMTSSRVASLGFIEREIDDLDNRDEMRSDHYLEEIRKLKRMVVEAREERIRKDELVVKRIVETKKMLEEDILQASSYGGLIS